MNLYEANLNKRYRESVLHERFLVKETTKMKEHLRGMKKTIEQLLKQLKIQKFHLKLKNNRHVNDDIVYLKTTIEELKVQKIKVREQLTFNMDTLCKFLIRLKLQQAAITFEFEQIYASKRRSG